MITFENGIDLRCREPKKATVARFNLGCSLTGGNLGYRFIVIGTDYGYIRTTGGDVRTWRSASGARKFAAAYEKNRS